MEDAKPQDFRGFRSPNTTPVPDEFFDQLLHSLSCAEVKVALYVIRRTFGFKKDKDNISLSQLVNGICTKDGVVLDRGTGLSKDSVTRAVKTLVEKKVIMRERRYSRERGDQPTTYKLNVIPVSEIRTPRGEVVGQGGVLLSDTQETVIQQTVNNNVNGIKSVDKLGEPPERTELIAQDILETLGDTQSLGFYREVAARIPEEKIYQTLSEIKQERGIKWPERVFTKRILKYVSEQRTRSN